MSRLLRFARSLLLTALSLFPSLVAAHPPASVTPPDALATAQQDVPQPATTAVAYRLAATWSDAPPRPGPGRFADAADIGSAPDGTVYVLDRYQNAVHVLSADGSPREIWPHPAAGADGVAWRWVRLDVGDAGAVHVLARAALAAEPGRPAEVRWRVDVLDGRGSVAVQVDLPTVGQERYVDLAVRADGRIYLTRTNGNVVRSGTFAIEIVRPDGTREAPLVPPELTIPINLDIDSDGTLYVVDQWPHSNAPAPGSGKVDGVAIFGPDHAYRETVQFSGAMDVAVGPAGVFVSRDNGIYPLRSRQSMFNGPTAQKSPYRLPSLGTPTMFSLDVPAAGPPRLLATMTHCTYQGVLAFGLGGTGGAGALMRPTFTGELDLPALRGPVYPLRAAFGSRLELLQGRFEPAPPGTSDAPFLSQLYTAHPQSVQHWSADAAPGGRLEGQFGLCGMWNAPLAYVDVAADGSDVYTIDHQVVVYRPDDHPPAWEEFALGLTDDVVATPHLVAVAADGGRAALLDAGSDAVLTVDAQGKPLGSWHPDSRTRHSTPTDIAMRGDLVALADGATGEIRLKSFEGGVPAGIVDGAPGRGIRAVALGPSGEVVALDRHGWAIRYASEPLGGAPGHRARAVTAWPMPDPDAIARDVAIDAAGRVYVPWVVPDPAPQGGVDLQQRLNLRRAGVWVFEPFQALELPADRDAVFASPSEAPHGCIVRADTSIQPRVVRPGETVEVRHGVDGGCAGRPEERLRLAIVFDASESMNTDNGFERGKAAVIDLLGRLDPASTEVMLIAMSEAASRENTCPGSPGDVRIAVSNLVAAGEPDWVGALRLAREALSCTDGEPVPARKTILVVTDGAVHEAGTDPGPALASLRAEGVETFAQLHPNTQTTAAQVDALTALVGGVDRILDSSTPEAIDGQADRLMRVVPPAGPAFTTLTVTARLSSDVDYVAGSALPPAAFDAATRTLSWRLGDPALDGTAEVRYRVMPRRIGSWVPALSEGTASVGGGVAGAASVALPNPALRVRDVGEAYLPRAGGGGGE